jgi:hypothetical protein|tara:strand:- start:513 stop:728 length:216 start_codon:yes stop_codon:yes gene_type:complete
MLKIGDINPDGIRVIINWERMVVGASVFVLCVNTEKAISQLTKITQAKGWDSTIRTVTEDGKLGVRIWRVT